MEDDTLYKIRLSLKSVSSYSDAEALEQIGTLIDQADIRADPTGIELAIFLSEELEKRQLEDTIYATLLYFVGNAWTAIERLSSDNSLVNWESEGREKTILYYRRALRHKGFARLTIERRCEILTNLANQFSSASFRNSGTNRNPHTYYGYQLRV